MGLQDFSIMGFVLRREVTVGDIFATGSFLVAFVALGITGWQLWRESIRKRAEFVLSVTTAYHVDKGAQKMLYNIEYDEFKYDSTFHGSCEERDLDRLLGKVCTTAAAAQHDGLLFMGWESHQTSGDFVPIRT